MPNFGPILSDLELHMTTEALAQLWPEVPPDTRETRAWLCHGPFALVAQTDQDIQRSVDRSLTAGKSPLLACLCPAGLTASTFRQAWLRLVTEGEGPAAWAVEWLLAQSTPAQRATLTRADYLACLTSPSGEVRFLGQQFVTETYVLPPRQALTTREHLARVVSRLGRRILRRPLAATPWTLPTEEIEISAASVVTSGPSRTAPPPSR